MFSTQMLLWTLTFSRSSVFDKCRDHGQLTAWSVQCIAQHESSSKLRGSRIQQQHSDSLQGGQHACRLTVKYQQLQRSRAVYMTGTRNHLGRMHDLLADVHLSEPLEHSQEGDVQSLPRNLVIPGSMIPGMATASDGMVREPAHVSCSMHHHGCSLRHGMGCFGVHRRPNMMPNMTVDFSFLFYRPGITCCLCITTRMA